MECTFGLQRPRVLQFSLWIAAFYFGKTRWLFPWSQKKSPVVTRVFMTLTAIFLFRWGWKPLRIRTVKIRAFGMPMVSILSWKSVIVVCPDIASRCYSQPNFATYRQSLQDIVNQNKPRSICNDRQYRSRSPLFSEMSGHQNRVWIICW